MGFNFHYIHYYKQVLKDHESKSFTNLNGGVVGSDLRIY